MNNAMKLLARGAGATARGAGLCSALLMSIASASASDATGTIPVADMMRAARSATSAEVFIVPRMVFTVKQIDQDEVPKYGCQYNVDQAHMAGLFAVIDKASIKDRITSEKHLDMRILIRLHSSDRALTTVAFETLAFPGEDLRGVVNDVAASAAADFYQILTQWVATLGQAAHPSSTRCTNAGGTGDRSHANRFRGPVAN